MLQLVFLPLLLLYLLLLFFLPFLVPALPSLLLFLWLRLRLALLPHARLSQGSLMLVCVLQHAPPKHR